MPTKSYFMLKKFLNFFFGKVKTGFAKYTVAMLLMKANNIYYSMLDNANFATPTPDMPGLRDLIDALQAAQDAVPNGGKAALATRDAAQADLIAALKILGTYVNYTSQGSVPILATSGFEVVKTGQPVIMQPVNRLEVTSMPNTNSLSIRAIGGSGIKGFVHQCSADPTLAENSWVSVNSTVRKYTFQNLVRGQEYFVRVICIGSNGQRSISDVIGRIVQ